MANVDLVDTELANLNIIYKEEDLMVVLEENNADEQLYDLFLVGRVLMDNAVNFPSLKITLADLWHPLRGVSITEMENKRILFQFYNEIGLKRVLDGLPWFFNRHLIIFHRLVGGEEPNSVTLWHTVFWVQVHNLPIGVTSKGTTYQLGDFVGKFMEYDTSLVTRGGSKFMQIRVLIDVNLPLKRKKRISIEGYCEVRLTLGSQQVKFGWDLSLRTTPRGGGQVVSKWLREEPKRDRWNDIEIDRERRELEDIPVEFVDGKKRQRFNSERKPLVDLRGLSEGDIENNISATTQKGRIREERQMAAFKEVLEYCELYDLGFFGQWYTCERGRLVDNNIREMLDRGVANTEWWDLFPRYKVNHLQHSFTNHCPVVVDTLGDGGIEAKESGIEFEYLGKKGEKRKDRRTKVLNGRLLEIGGSEISDAILEEITEIKLELNFEADKEELFWEQRARVNWLRMRDWNTAFFHKSATHHRRKNMIKGLENEAGNLITDKDEISNLATDYFK
ncbi:hypothetical protein Golax_011824 [Gossypium laxum]|uniref:DUF4283 domain-containing protein n=1 Tax=Gossypium laxum TaxID=34288 RepID=A0A7J8ZLM8_9ROSI|nr:hypothetical protein [Gossypium laxum]